MATSDVEQPGWRWRVWPWRRSAAPEVLLPALAHYRSLDRHRVRNFIGIGVLMLFCLIYGFFFSAFVPSYFAFFMLPLAGLGLLVIWALPEVNWAPTRALRWTFYASFIGLIIWPNYLAIALPGLPWITVIRLTTLPMLLLLLTCLSMSADFRASMLVSLRAIPAIPILFGIFIVIQIYTIGFSHSIAGSVQRFIVAQTSWTAMFFAGAYVFRRPGEIKRWSMVLWAMAIIVSLIAVWEYRLGRLPWLGHIPGFLKVDDEAVQNIMVPHMRAGTTRYRAESTFSTPLGLAEYLALTIPFVLHFTTQRFSRRIRIGAFVSIPLILYADYLSDAKLGTIGALFGILAYIFMASYHNWRRNKISLIAASVLFAYPLGVGLIGIMMLASHRFSVMILGNDGSHANSTQARIEQYHLGWQKILEWPFGYGIGQAGDTLGFGQDIGGMITIDTYYLSIVLEYGVIGFIVYYGMFAIAIYEGARRLLLAPTENEDRSFILPIIISLVVFIIIKGVFSQVDNHPIVFMMLGGFMALTASYQKPVKATQTGRSRTPRRTSIDWLNATGASRPTRV